MATNPDLSKWGSATEILLIAQIGDLIECSRTGYKHWAVYIGHNYVIHVGKEHTNPLTSARIKRERLQDIYCKGDQCRINNLTTWATSKGLQALPPHQIVKNAEEYLGQPIDYSLLSDNCEFFATNCRYGKSFCQQLDSKSKMFSNIAVGGAIVGALSFAASFFLDHKQKNGDRVYEKNNTNRN